MTSNTLVRLAFLMAVAVASIIQIRLLFFTNLQETVHRRMPEKMDVPNLGANRALMSVQNERVGNTANIRSNENSIFAHQTSNQTGPKSTSLPRIPNNTTTLGPIFYNVFIPKDRKRATIDIIKEQVNQRNKSDPEAPIQYTLIGSKSVDESIQTFCQPNCTKREHLEEGNEIDTLQALWEHCQDHPFEIVTYIHDKGSFHPSGANRGSRQVGTKAAMECRRLMLDNEKILTSSASTNESENLIKKKAHCSLCSYRFYAIPVFHTRANMWTAKCSYIRSLIAPKEYEEKALNMHRETFNHSIWGPTKYACIRPYQHSDRFLGLGRYAMERWVVNHPDVEPCDALSKFEVRNQKKSKKTNTDFTPKLTPSPQKRALNSGMASYKTSWERLAGRLFEWKYLYGKSPHKSSWVWKYYKKFKEGNKEFLEFCRAMKTSAINNVTLLNVTLDENDLTPLENKLEITTQPEKMRPQPNMMLHAYKCVGNGNDSTHFRMCQK
jgi:hypothetical protein